MDPRKRALYVEYTENNNIYKQKNKIIIYKQKKKLQKFSASLLFKSTTLCFTGGDINIGLCHLRNQW